MKKILILGALISSAAMAAGDVSVSNCLIQEVIPGKQMTGAFFDIENKGKEDVKLTGAAADKITSHVELHEMIHKDGKMEMSQIQEYNVTPGSVHHFKKGGYHVMLMDIEDKNFWKHPGVDPRGLARSIVIDLAATPHHHHAPRALANQVQPLE